MAQRYKRPPITEAVIEVRIGRPIDAGLLEKLQKRLSRDYPLPPQRTVHINVHLGDESATVKREFEGYKLTATDGASVVSVTPRLISTSRLAPYEGWDQFVKQAVRNWRVWRRIVGWRDIARIGVRFINRVDVSNPKDEPVELERYLNISPRLPEIGQKALNDFSINIKMPLGQGDLNLILNASSAPSPLVKTTSFIIDLDVSRDTDLPTDDEGLWDCIAGVREQKNAVFEACITDRARDLFGR